ncbi:hypothetical protein [Roseateles sp.]|uniref:hypothetical protein n=1 Tax=Roseateles sp. TaxID=1971397 RepID=UPI0039E848A3
MSSSQLVEQRVRNRIIEWLELIVEYEASPPGFDLNEVLNQWEDWNPCATTNSESYPTPVYTSSETVLLVSVHHAWQEFCGATPQIITQDSSELIKPQWATLVSVATSALGELNKRGKLPEDHASSFSQTEA